MSKVTDPMELKPFLNFIKAAISSENTVRLGRIIGFFQMFSVVALNIWEMIGFTDSSRGISFSFSYSWGGITEEIFWGALTVVLAEILNRLKKSEPQA